MIDDTLMENNNFFVLDIKENERWQHRLFSMEGSRWIYFRTLAKIWKEITIKGECPIISIERSAELGYSLHSLSICAPNPSDDIFCYREWVPCRISCLRALLEIRDSDTQYKATLFRQIFFILRREIMKLATCTIILALCLSAALGQVCKGRFNEFILGECQAASDCRGTVLSGITCEGKRCCINETTTPSLPTCLNHTVFLSAYNSTRGLFLAQILDYGISRAGLCGNCQGKAAFLAIAAAMTENFEKDEATGSEGSFTADDRRYNNTETGDGLRFRRRGFFGLRGRAMYERLQALMPQYPVVAQPELAAIVDSSIEIAAQQWKLPNLQTGPSLTQYADGTFYSFSLLW